MKKINIKHAGLLILLVAGATVCYGMTGPQLERQNRKDNPARNRALLDAVREGDVAQVQDLIDAGADFDMSGPYRDSLVPDTPLMVAAEKGHADVVRVLLEAGADMNRGVSSVIEDEDGISYSLDVYYFARNKPAIIEILEKEKKRRQQQEKGAGEKEKENKESKGRSSAWWR